MDLLEDVLPSMQHSLQSLLQLMSTLAQCHFHGTAQSNKAASYVGDLPSGFALTCTPFSQRLDALQ